MTPTATPTAMPTTAHIRFYMISDHVKLNKWYFKGDATPTAIPTTVHHQFYTTCNANHSPYSILHYFGPCKIEYMILLGWLGVAKSHTNCNANHSPYSILHDS
jgi:hypothetical protein